VSDRLVRFPGSSWQEIEALPQPLRWTVQRTIFHLLDEPVPALADPFPRDDPSRRRQHRAIGAGGPPAVPRSHPVPHRPGYRAGRRATVSLPRPHDSATTVTDVA
jgi:hypothetical protein